MIIDGRSDTVTRNLPMHELRMGIPATGSLALQKKEDTLAIVLLTTRLLTYFGFFLAPSSFPLSL